MLYVLDTNAWSDVLRGAGKVGRKLSTVPSVRVLLAAPVLYELRRGAVARETAFKRGIDQLVQTYAVATLDGDAAEAAARLSLSLRRAGRMIHHLDALIAGIAIARGATLVTRDKDFAKAPGLTVESWA